MSKKRKDPIYSPTMNCPHCSHSNTGRRIQMKGKMEIIICPSCKKRYKVMELYMIEEDDGL